MNEARARLLPEAVLALAALAAWWWLEGRVLPDDVGWQFWTARQMLGGARLYADLWEVNPPLWFWSAMPLAWLAEATGTPWGSVLAGAVAALGAVSAWLAARLLEPRSAPERLALMLLAFAVMVVMPAALLGQREQLALIGALPYAALIARRHAGRAVSPGLAVAVAVLAAYGFALKHYFVAVPVLLEAWLMLRQRGGWRPWRPELWVLAGLAVAYAAAVVTLAPGFFAIMLPMVNAAYFAAQQPLVVVLVKPYVLFWVVAGLALVLTRRLPVHEASPADEAAMPAMLLVFAGFTFAYVLQGRGWNYHAIAASGAMAMALGLRVVRLRSVPGALVLGALLAAAVWGLFPYRPERAPEDSYLDRVAAGEGVFLAGFDAGPLWRRGREALVPVSRSYSYWMVYAIARAEAEGRVTPELAALRDQVLAAASEDIRCNPPQLILLQATPEISGPGGAFSLEAFLLGDPALRQFVAEHYGLPEHAGGMTAWFRRGTVARAPGLACRDIR